MKLTEAYKLLELEETATPEEAKKKYRQFTKQFHPDINKEPGAEDKFKAINQAYECIKSGKGNDREDFIPEEYYHGWGGGFNPFGSSNPFQQQTRPASHIQLNIDISFKDSVLGCKKDLKFTRKNKCQKCNGQGTIKLNNGCKKCHGQGQVISQKGNMMFQSVCPLCHGRSNVEKCEPCKAAGTVDHEVSVSVKIPGGVTSESVLKMQGYGNFVGSFMGVQDQFTDANCKINVALDPDLSLKDGYVILNHNISLLDALTGTTRSVKTVLGDKEISIPPLSKNKEEIIIKNVGVDRKGEQKVILHIDYPEDTSDLIELLKGKANAVLSELSK